MKYFSGLGDPPCYRRLASLIAVATMFCIPAIARADGGDHVGHWHLLISKRSYDTTPTQKTFAQGFPDRDAGHPFSVTTKYVDPDGDKIAVDTSVPFDCNPADATPATHSCDFVDEHSSSQPNEHEIDFTVRSHGGRGVVIFHMLRYAPVTTKEATADSDWIVGKSFIVQVPADATSATIIGEFRGSSVLLTPSDPLSQDDAKRFALVAAKPIPDASHPVMTIYEFRVLDPGQ